MPFPTGRVNLDSEDVKTMLVQKTTGFFAIQFLFLSSALLVYVLTDTYAYRMMNIVASLAVASSMAGRIFRRAWRQTRDLASNSINRPPSYFPAWAEEHQNAVSRGHDDQFTRTPPGSRHQDKRDSSDFYVKANLDPSSKPAPCRVPPYNRFPGHPCQLVVEHNRSTDGGRTCSRCFQH